MIFKTNPNNGFDPAVSKLSFHLNDSGKLVKITLEYALLEIPTRESLYVLPGSCKTPSEEWNFVYTEPAVLKAHFKRLALENPEDFKKLYYILKEHDEKMFPIIHSVLKEVKKLFDFN